MLVVRRMPAAPAEQGARRVEVQAGHGQRRQAAHQRVALGGADAEQDDDGIGRQPAGGEGEGVGRGGIRRVQVVHHHGDRSALGVAAEQAQHGRADGEPVTRIVGRGRSGQRQRRGERLRLDRRDPVQFAERGTDELQQGRERDLGLGLQPGRAQYPHRGEVPDAVVEQRRLPHAGLAGEREHAAGAQAGRGHQPIDRLQLGLPTHQHPPSLGTAPELGHGDFRAGRGRSVFEGPRSSRPRTRSHAIP